jgi:hypothetical protein
MQGEHSMRPENERHPDDEQMESYSAGSLPEEARGPFEEHLLLCDLCQDRLTESDAYVAAIKEAARRLKPGLKAPRMWWEVPRFIPVLAAAAVLAAVALLGVWARLPSGPEPALWVTLEANRGVIQAHAPAGRPLVLRLDPEGLPETRGPYGLEIVDRGGGRAWHGAAAPGRIGEVSVPGLAPGVYFVRVSAASGELLREYGLEVSGG